MRNLSKIRIGITGGIGSGKSYLLNEFRKRNYFVIDLDEFIHKLYVKPNKLFYIVDEEFNLNSKSEIDRKKLKSIVFNDEAKLKKLNEITHKVIKEELINFIENSEYSVVVIEIPLLFEAKFEDVVDSIVLAYSSEEERIKRIVARDNITEKQALNIISKQMNLEEKKVLSDFIVDLSNENNFDEIIKEIILKTR